MKRVISLAILCMFFSLSSFAQNDVFSKGSSQIKAGVGFGTYFTFPPVHISYETPVYSFSDKLNLGVGGFAGIEGWNNLIYWGVGADALIHYSFNSSFDVYSGPALRYLGVTATNTSYNHGGFNLSWIIGFQYYFSDSFGAFLQEGGFSTASIGIAYRF